MDREELDDETLDDDADDTDAQQPISEDDSTELVVDPQPCESQTSGTLGSGATILVSEKVRCNQ